LPFDDEQRLAREDEEILLLGLPVIRARLAGAHHPNRHSEHREERLGFVLVVAGEREAVPCPGFSNQRVSRVFSTNRPALVGARPAPVSSSVASGTTPE
jgi:hypothetical protein